MSRLNSRCLESLLTWAEIDLDALKVNLGGLQRHVGPGVQIMAVVKANAYGHGAEQVARAVLAAGAGRLAVHRLEEGIQLREAGIRAPILIMGYTPLGVAPEVVAHGLTPTVISEQGTQALARAVSDREGSDPMSAWPVHLKVDTGLGRFGLLPHEVVDFAAGLGRLPGLKLEGIFTHFATADASDRAYLHTQLESFNTVLAALAERGIHIPLRHACNSAATMILPAAHFQAVRPGIALYGLLPSQEWDPPFPLQPLLTLKSRIVRLRTLPPGSSIGYGRTHITDRSTRVALVPIGYGDGYHRLLSGRGSVLVAGTRAPVLGRVSMDQIVVDVSKIPQAAMEEEVVLIGRQGEETISAEEVAGRAQTINYEITTGLLPRVTRVYRQEGRIAGIRK